MSAPAVQVRFEDSICFLRFIRPEAGNPIDGALIRECQQALTSCRNSAVTVVVIEGEGGIFCSGADLQAAAGSASSDAAVDAEALYALWLELATGPYVSVAHVEGKASAGGLGFVAACDLVIASDSATFALPEMLFGLMPACVLPFLLRRVGESRAGYMSLSTLPITVEQACSWGLVDVHAARSEQVLRKHLQRLACLRKESISHYKTYASELSTALRDSGPAAIAANRMMFQDPYTREALRRYASTGRFPWEK